MPSLLHARGKTQKLRRGEMNAGAWLAADRPERSRYLTGSVETVNVVVLVGGVDSLNGEHADRLIRKTGSTAIGCERLSIVRIGSH